MIESPINYLLGVGVPWASPAATTVAGFSRADADEILQVVTKTKALPATYAPKDVVYAARNGIAAYDQILIRKIIIPDTLAMFRAAAAEKVRLQVISGYRSYAVQQMVFAKWTRKSGSAEEASLYSALPGHSQHQLGVALDLNSFGRSFQETAEGRWIWNNAHRFGFVLPFTLASSPVTGFAYEPWHVRWVGRELAQIMERVGYKESSVFTADALVAAVREVARLTGASAVIRRPPDSATGFPGFIAAEPRAF